MARTRKEVKPLGIVLYDASKHDLPGYGELDDPRDCECDDYGEEPLVTCSSCSHEHSVLSSRVIDAPGKRIVIVIDERRGMRVFQEQ